MAIDHFPALRFAFRDSPEDPFVVAAVVVASNLSRPRSFAGAHGIRWANGFSSSDLVPVNFPMAVGLNPRLIRYLCAVP